MEAVAVLGALLLSIFVWAWVASRRREATWLPEASTDFLRDPAAARSAAEAWARASDRGDLALAVERERWHDGPTVYVRIRRKGSSVELQIDDLEQDAAGPMPPPRVERVPRAELVDRLAALFLGGKPRPLGPRRGGS